MRMSVAENVLVPDMEHNRQAEDGGDSARREAGPLPGENFAGLRS